MSGVSGQWHSGRRRNDMSHQEFWADNVGGTMRRRCRLMCPKEVEKSGDDADQE
jgi:hypothetical protein